MIYVSVDSPNLGFPYFNFLGEAQCKTYPVLIVWLDSNIHAGHCAYSGPQGIHQDRCRDVHGEVAFSEQDVALMMYKYAVSV